MLFASGLILEVAVFALVIAAYAEAHAVGRVQIGGEGCMALHGTLLPPRANAGRHVGAVVGDGVGCKHAHQSAHGVAAIESTLRAAHDVDTFDTLK